MKPVCEPFAAAVLDADAVKPAGFSGHLDTCADCASLRAAHRGAQSLRGVALPRAPRVSRRAVLARGAVVLTAVGLLGVALMRPEPRSDEVARAPIVDVKPEGALEAAPADGSLEALALLDQTVTRYARVNPIAAGYGERFGSLPYFLAPEDLP